MVASTYGAVAGILEATSMKRSGSRTIFRISSSPVPTAKVIENVRLSPTNTPYFR